MAAARAFTAVLTKPEGQSAALAAQLAAAGIDSLDFPLIDIAPAVDFGPLDAALARLDAYALVVFVSPNAIDRALARFGAIWPHSLPVGVVGPGSVAALARHGIAAPAHRVIAPGAPAPDGLPESGAGPDDGEPRYDSESLYAQIERAFGASRAVDPAARPADQVADDAAGARASGGVALDRRDDGATREAGVDPGAAQDSSDSFAVPASSGSREPESAAHPAPDSASDGSGPSGQPPAGPLAGKRVLIVRGDGGREWLATRLREAGAEVELVAAYRRIVPEPSIGAWERVHALLGGAPHAWLVTSSEGVRNLHELAIDHLTAVEIEALQHAPLVAPHPRIADTARALGFDTITQSGAGDERIVRAFRTLADTAAHAAQAASVPSRMTDTNDSSKATSAGTGSAPARPAAPTPPPNPPFTPFEAQGPKRRGGAAGVLLWCVVVVLACGAGAGGYVLNRKIDQLDRLTVQRQNALDAATAAARRQSEQALANSHQVDGQVAQFAGKLADAQAQQQALQQQYQDLSRNRDAWLLDQVEQTLSGASQQLQLTGDTRLALVALQNADAQLATSQGAQAIAVRKALAQDIDKLKAAPAVDLTGLAIKLDDAIGRIDALPLAGEAPIGRAVPRAAHPADVAQQAAATGQPRWKIWWHDLSTGVAAQLTSLVQVRRIDNADAMLTSPEQGYFVRENVKLRLLSARLSLLARNDAAMKSDLHAAQAALGRYFDASSKDTRTVQDLLRQVDAASLSVAVPNLNTSLSAIQQFKSRG
ncbi:fused uroporphyrinogen-III synthase HemD/membrane protein HemX [Burkholderia plantarii]|uniref:fused uroporphyrinogen-III synthase HemD/membrane protein HemX n=1 Tax=Burkholderia plantarii TaxID=41899 RepID=UPI0027DE422C|nr:fused uroporphyrinogen-III synthase HemD/membrane protein HemX [Burkholderia plantarii]